jgi:hypothetical protein
MVLKHFGIIAPKGFLPRGIVEDPWFSTPFAFIEAVRSPGAFHLAAAPLRFFKTVPVSLSPLKTSYEVGKVKRIHI